MSTNVSKLRVKVTPATSSDMDRYVTVATTSGPISFFVPCELLDSKNEVVQDVYDWLSVTLINVQENSALIQLPVDPLWGGRRVVVHAFDVIPREE